MLSNRNHVKNAVVNRRSIRKYRDNPISQDQMSELLLVAQKSPSAKNLQPYYIRFITNTQLIEELHNDYGNSLDDELPAVIAEGHNFIHNAPCFIMVFGEDDNTSVGVNSGILVANLANATYGMGLGSCIIGCIQKYLNTPEAKSKWHQKLHIPEGYSFQIGMALGHPDEEPLIKHKELNRILFMQ